MNSSEPIAVYLLDDDASQLRAYSRLIRSAGWVAMPFETPTKFLDAVRPESKGCLLLDFAMPEMTGLVVQERLRNTGVHLPIVFLTAHGDVPLSVRAMQGGAVNFLCKPCEAAELLEAIRLAIESDSQFHKIHAAAFDFARRLAALTPREREVLDQVVLGKLNKQIATELGTVEKTVKVHRGRVMKKLDASSVADLVRLYEQVRNLNLPG